MSIELHESLLKSANVPLRLSIVGIVDDGQPIMVPLWFVYERVSCGAHVIATATAK